MKTIIIDNFLSKEECISLINFYEKNKESSFLYRDVYPSQNLEINHNSEINFLFKKLQSNTVAVDVNSKIDWCQIVKWPTGSKQDLHFDTASNKTTFSSIVYLNENFEGGQTYYEDGTTIQPVTGRGLFFDGIFYKHGVKEVSKNIRYVVATWYKKNE